MLPRKLDRGALNHRKKSAFIPPFIGTFVLLFILSAIGYYWVVSMLVSSHKALKYKESHEFLSRRKRNISWSGFVEIVPGTLVYTAYYDPGFPFVSVIGTSETHNKRKLFCHSTIDSDKIEEAKLHQVPSNRPHGTFLISCSFPSGLVKHPGTLSLSAIYNNKRSRPVTIPVHSIVERHYIHNYTICGPPIRSSSLLTTVNFVEFVEMNRILGASYFTFYDDEIHQELNKAIQTYQDEGVVELLPWNLPRDIKLNLIHYHGQQIAILDCLYRSRGRAKWVGFHDLDEFVVPLKYATVPSLLRDIDTPQTAGFYIQVVYMTRKPLRSTNNTPLNETLLTQHFILRSKESFNGDGRNKCIVNPNKVFMMNIHRLDIPLQNRQLNWLHPLLDEKWLNWLNLRLFYQRRWLDPGIVLLFHYRECGPPLCKELVLEHFMLKFRDTLVKNVGRVMRLIE